MSLELKNIYKNYNKFNKKQVLNNLSLSVMNNKICSIIGVNGVGKSTLIKSILGLIKLDNGSIEYNNKPISNLMKQGKVGYLPEYLDFSKSISLYTYLNDMAIIKGIDKLKASKRIDYLLELFDLDKNKNDIIYKFSKGMKKKVGFIQSILNFPELLILDEPTDGLDPKSRRTMLTAIKDLTLKNCTVIITSHILADLELISDTVVIIDNGIVIEKISHEKFSKNELHLKILLNNDEIENIESNFTDDNFIIQCNSSKNIKEIQVNTNHTGLEDLFLNSLQKNRST